MAKDLVFKALNVFHKSVLRATFGRVGWTAGGMAVLELTTVGRRSGRPRTVILTSPVQEGESLLIVASRGGDERHPDWFLNLEANPQVKVTMKGATRSMRARVATVEESDRLWPQVVAASKHYGGYRARTHREIPLVFLDAA